MPSQGVTLTGCDTVSAIYRRGKRNPFNMVHKKDKDDFLGTFANSTSTHDEFGYYAALCVDNNFLVELPRTSAKNNNFKKCPLIHGFNKDEASVFILYSFPSYLNSSETPYVSKKRFDRELTALLTAYGRYINDLIEEGLTQVYLDWAKVDDPAADYYEDWKNVATDYCNPNKESFSSPPYNDDTAWPAFTLPELQYKELAINMTTGRGLKADECHFWNEHLEQLTTFTANLEETERQWREEFHSWKYTDMEEWRDTFDEYQPNTDNGKISSPRNEL
ncbi:acetylcholinesterase-like [Amphiura filiformis]|uniref:acetylcholinesterase-like n=1 Tax=Amphiura filiformis TaxID=82378 RepID=UPI003B21D8B2